MSKKPARRSRSAIARSVPPSRGTSDPSLELIYEFNDSFVAHLAEAARKHHSPPAGPEMMRAHWKLWVSLDAAARRRASRCPFLLADIEFRNKAWWQRARSNTRWRGEPAGAGRLFSCASATLLTRDALLVAWSISRQDIRLAVTLLPMSSEVARVVAQLGSAQLRHIAERHYPHLRPRWEQRAELWGRLLSAASRADHEALHEARLGAFQLAHLD